MPPRKKNCESIIAMKKKKLIDNRLLEISILVEDYIYEDKPIKRHEAEMYAKEVASYVDKCLGDKRSLQVIEKLFRHMRGIIAELGEPVDEDIFAQPLPGNTPVLDDNMTQCTPGLNVKDLTQGFNGPDCVEEPDNTGRDKRKGKRYRLSSELYDDLTQCMQDIESDDITQELDSPNGVKESVKKARNKKRATVKRNRQVSSEIDDLTECTQTIEFEDLNEELSSLNTIQTPIKKVCNKIKAVKRNMRKTYSLDDDMTQCSLSDKVSVEKPNARNKRNTIVKSNIRKTKVKRSVSRNYNSDLDLIDLCDDNDDKVTVYKSSQDLRSSLYIQNTPAILSVCSSSILNSIDAVPRIPKSKEDFKKPSPENGNVIDTNKNVDRSILIKDNNGLINEFTNKNISEEEYIPFPIKDNDIEKMKINQNTQINHNLKNHVLNAQKTSVNPIEISKNKVNKAHTYSKVNTYKKGSIYSDKVINDLSWIENIKYVREIAKEEYEKVLVPDNFWDNYMLPEKWNDDDFLYT